MALTIESNIVQCVINISEGRVIHKIKAVKEIFVSTGLQVLHIDIGYDANRTVFTLLGSAHQLFESIRKLLDFAVKHFDITNHIGNHPRIGILDVIPFVPIKNISVDQLQLKVRAFCQEISTNYDLPIILYANLSTNKEQQTLHQLRRRPIKLTLGSSILPDYGPHRPHDQLGASCVTVREIMVAYNINLETTDLIKARKLNNKLLKIRNQNLSPHDLSRVKFLAWYVQEYNCCQISTNIYDIQAISMFDLYQYVSKQAELHGIKVEGSELIGMAPWSAITRQKSRRDEAMTMLGLNSVRVFNEKKQILDYFMT